MNSQGIDSLTKRLMSRSGLNPVDPTLPPVHNLRMVHLDEKLDVELHEARGALHALEQSQKAPLYAATATAPAFDQTAKTAAINAAKTALITAMKALQASEQDYFANRYLRRGQKPVLVGWHGKEKQDIFTAYLAKLKAAADAQVTKVGFSGYSRAGYHQTALDAANHYQRATARLIQMNKDCYVGGVTTNARVDTNLLPPAVAKGVSDIKKLLDDIVSEREKALQLPTGTDKTNSLREISVSLLGTQRCLRLAGIVAKNRWELPFDLRK